MLVQVAAYDLRLAGLSSFSLDGREIDSSHGDFVQHGFAETGQGKGDLQIRIRRRRTVQRELLPALGDWDSLHQRSTRYGIRNG